MIGIGEHGVGHPFGQIDHADVLFQSEPPHTLAQRSEARHLFGGTPIGGAQRVFHHTGLHAEPAKLIEGARDMCDQALAGWPRRERRMKLELSVSDRHLYVSIGDTTLTGTVQRIDLG